MLHDGIGLCNILLQPYKATEIKRKIYYSYFLILSCFSVIFICVQFPFPVIVLCRCFLSLLCFVLASCILLSFFLCHSFSCFFSYYLLICIDLSLFLLPRCSLPVDIILPLCRSFLSYGFFLSFLCHSFSCFYSHSLLTCVDLPLRISYFLAAVFHPIYNPSSMPLFSFLLFLSLFFPVSFILVFLFLLLLHLHRFALTHFLLPRCC